MSKARRTNTDRALDLICCFRGEIRQQVDRWWRTAKLFEDCLEWRTRVIYGHPRWSKLQGWAKHDVNTYFAIMFDQLQNKLVWTHTLDGRRILSGAPETEGRAKEIYDQNNTFPNCSAYCYAYLLETGTILLVPYRKKERDGDLQEGRLNRALLTAVYDRKTEPLFRYNRRGGSQGLARTQIID